MPKTSRNDSPEGRRVDAYLGTIERIEPEVAPIDASAFYASAAISLKRLADATELVVVEIENIADLLKRARAPKRKPPRKRSAAKGNGLRAVRASLRGKKGIKFHKPRRVPSKRKR